MDLRQLLLSLSKIKTFQAPAVFLGKVRYLLLIETQNVVPDVLESRELRFTREL